MDRIKVLLVEEQEILRDAYKTVISQDPSFDLVGISDTASMFSGNGKSVESILLDTNPDIVLIGTKLVQTNTIAGLEIMRRDFPQMGIVLLSAHFDAESISRLKSFARSSRRGAYLLKGSINTGNDLTRAISDVSEGRVIVDPQVFAGLIQDSDMTKSQIAGLTARELEVLGWLSMGYRNAAIAQVLCLEPKTVERHISNIFSKLSSGENDLKHPRVDAVLSYYKATGQLQIDVSQN